jgi:hypothetical protein
MALVIETGAIVPTANSYVTLDEIKAYASARGVTLGADSVIERFAILAMDYLESLRSRYYGSRVDPANQPLSWPRLYVFMECQPFPATSIPQGLKSAQCQLCLEQANGVDLMPTQEAGSFITQESVGPISTSYNPAYSFSAPSMPKVDALLEPLMSTGLFVRRA